MLASAVRWRGGSSSSSRNSTLGRGRGAPAAQRGELVAALLRPPRARCCVTPAPSWAGLLPTASTWPACRHHRDYSLRQRARLARPCTFGRGALSLYTCIFICLLLIVARLIDVRSLTTDGARPEQGRGGGESAPRPRMERGRAPRPRMERGRAVTRRALVLAARPHCANVAAESARGLAIRVQSGRRSAAAAAARRRGQARGFSPCAS